MRRRQPVPTLWLMTDERLGDDLWRALMRLPRGAGVVFRHYATPIAERRRVFARVLRVGRARDLLVVRAGSVAMRGEMGTHRARGPGLVTWPVHSLREAGAARRAGADVVFVSPVFSTRSHPGAGTLGVVGGAALARRCAGVRVALGGMDARRFSMTRGFEGWAAIDAWAR